jgi:hypothetical protein
MLVSKREAELTLSSTGEHFSGLLSALSWGIGHGGGFDSGGHVVA